MKNISKIVLGLWMTCLLAFPVRADNISPQELQRQQAIQAEREIQQQAYQNSRAEYVQSVRQSRIQDDQNVKEWRNTNESAKQLQQINQQTQGELNSFSKL